MLKDKEAILQFLAHGYPAFQRRWETRPGERFEHALGQVEPIVPTMAFRSSGEDGFAHRAIASAMASRTAGSSGVVAAWSRYMRGIGAICSMTVAKIVTASI